MMNVGEFDEMRIKLRLIELRDKNIPLIIGGNSINITSVKMEGEFLPLPIGTNLNTLTDIQVKTLADRLGASKAPGRAKADVYINGEGYSIKSHRAAPPAIVNHTPRIGYTRICKQIGVNISILDELVEKYFKFRTAGIIREDVRNTDNNSPFKDHIEELRPILNYFVFKGSGSADSKYPAKYVLSCNDALNTKQWSLYDETNYLDSVWNNLVFSMRNKGFDSYDPTSNDAKNVCNRVWAKIFDGSYKGSLHIRES